MSANLAANAVTGNRSGPHRRGDTRRPWPVPRHVRRRIPPRRIRYPTAPGRTWPINVRDEEIFERLPQGKCCVVPHAALSAALLLCVDTGSLVGLELAGSTRVGYPSPKPEGARASLA
jgi:hypothetical protein